MRGRKPDPRAARRGTAHHRKATDIVPAQLSGAIPPERISELPAPRQLPRTKAVRQMWQSILCEIARHELRSGDLPLIEMLCLARFRHLQAGELIKVYGPLVKGPYGPTTNPMIKVERDQAMLYDRLAQRLGLSPEARIRLDLMQVAGSSLAASLRRSLEEGLEQPGNEVIEGDVMEEDE